ncbi:MAG: polysaccharide biosynthesis C-terminal domain-containing protein [Bacteroidota bacterium]
MTAFVQKIRSWSRWINNVNAFQFFQLFRAGSAILISIILAKSSLGLADIAVYEWLLYIGLFVSFFWINAFLQALLPTFPQLSTDLQRPFLANVYLLFVGVSSFLALMLWLQPELWIRWLTGQNELPWFSWYILFIWLNLPTSLVEYIYLLNNRSRQVLLYGILSFGGYFVAVVGPILLGYGLGGAIRSIVLVGALRFIWLTYLVRPWQYTRWQATEIKNYIWLALPLIVYTFLAGAAQMFDNWLVGWYYEDKEPFAIFRYGARELPLATALAGGLSAAMIPEVSKNVSTALGIIRQKSLRIIHWLYPISIVLMLISPFLYPLVYSDAFSASARIFNIYLLLLVSRVLLPYSILMGLKQTRAILFISVSELLVNVILSLLLIGEWGLEGIAVATVVAFLFEKLLMITYIYYKYSFSPKTYIPIRCYLIYSTLLIVAFFLSWQWT